MKIAEVQKKNKTLGVPNGGSIDTTKTIALQIPHWPEKMKEGFLVPEIAHNLVSVAEICDAGGNVFFKNMESKLNSRGK